MTTKWLSPHLDDPDLTVEQSDALRPAADDEANLDGSPNSYDEDPTHSIVLDLDCLHEYRESTTPGHGHLIIPAELTWEQYRNLLEALAVAGVISRRYLVHALRRRGSFVRVAGLKKPDGAKGSDDPLGTDASNDL